VTAGEERYFLMIVIGTVMSRILPLAVGIGDIASWVAAAATLGLLIAAVIAGQNALDTLRTQQLTVRRQRVYGLLDRDLADKALMVIAYAWWLRAASFVDWAQHNSNAHAYEEWRQAAETYSAAHPQEEAGAA
jgi:hypothetical protein